jgi:lipopolysaccharide/colanic/teichoic acid biosynthesis glycosyltransferase
MQPFLLRTLDIVLALTGIIFGLPVMLLIYLIGLFLNGSPLFFQQRVGKDQKLFTLIKFRTMAHDTESLGTHLVDSVSITKFGAFLRKTKLDELPQLFNVFLGTMSLVGPRPCLPNQTYLIDERDKRCVFRVRPGITGLAQVNEVDMSTARKLARYDQLMIDRMCLKLYVKLIITTALGKGRGDRVRTALV